MGKIYGNHELVATLENMVSTGRTAHTVLFYGEKGSGRKLMADYYTQLLLCEGTVDGKPCNKCSSCHNFIHAIHPDVTYAATSGKLGGYNVSTAREICTDAFIKPNNSTARKVYIFRDCNKMNVAAQNALLKLIEEPPDYAYFIFTAESKSDLLPTVISRCVCFGTHQCTEEETRAALRDNCFEDAAIDEAVECFHGNIGRCIDYIVSEKLRNTVNLTKSLTRSIINKDEYILNSVMFNLGKERDDVRNTLSLLDMLIRDAAVLGKDPSARTIGCWREGAEMLSAEIAPFQAVNIHRRIERTWKAIESNINIPLALTALCGEIIDILH